MGDKTGNPNREKGSRNATDTTPIMGYTKNDQHSNYKVLQNGITMAWSTHANTAQQYWHHPAGSHVNWSKDGSLSMRAMGETRFEGHAMTLTTSENIDIASGGMLTVKTVGGLEAQISGEGQITIGGAATINILNDATIGVQGNATISAGGSASIDAAGISLSSSAGIAIGAAGGISLQAGGGIKMQESGSKVSGYMGGGNES